MAISGQILKVGPDLVQAFQNERWFKPGFIVLTPQPQLFFIVSGTFQQNMSNIKLPPVKICNI